jgi:NDP-hexose-3-ketoreductase
MTDTKILILGYSSFIKRRVIPSLKKNKKIKYCICSESNKINKRKKILFNNYNISLKKFKPNIVYISKINSLHYKFAKMTLNKGFNTIVDKPATLNLKQTKELLKIAKTKKLFFAEATLFNYHRVFKSIKKLYRGINQVEHIQSNFNIPFYKSPNELKIKKNDCEADMSPYAASIIRLFLKGKINKLNVYKNYFKGTKLVKSFYIIASINKLTYFGNFAFQRNYDQQIIFYTKDKTIYSPKRIFAQPSHINSLVIIKTKNKIKKIMVKKDDCIDNFFKLVLNTLRKKNYEYFYNMILQDSKIRNIITKFN